MPQRASEVARKNDRNSRKRTIVIIAVVCLLLVISFCFVSPPEVFMSFSKAFQSSGQNIINRKLTPEVPICENINVVNWYAYHRSANINCTIYAQSSNEQHLELRQRLQERRGAVDDAIRTVISNATLEDIYDPQLSSVKTQLQSQMERIVGGGLVEEILIPKWHARGGRNSYDPHNANTQNIWESLY